MSKYIQTPERVKSCLKACEDFADPVSAVRDNFAFGTDMANTVNRLRAINAKLLDSPSERLRRICDDLEKYKHESPYSAGAWDELMEEKIRAKDEIDRLRAVNAELLAALQGLFEHCAMIHKHWGDGDNSKTADDAQKAARAAIANAQGEAA